MPTTSAAAYTPKALIAAIATAPGRGGIGVVRVSGIGVAAIIGGVTATREPINSEPADAGKQTGGSATRYMTDVATRMFGSRHPGGCHFATADGAVRFVTDSISITVYYSAGARADGGPLGGIP